MSEKRIYDVAIIGGGPAGSTAGCLLKKYKPELKVVILEREAFPRDHVGESQLPGTPDVLNEMGVWDKVEAANFPIKIGATYLWGRTPELWNFEFTPSSEFVEEPRPAKYQGQRRVTAFQVDRSIYDKILLDHAAEMGCEVRESTKVSHVRRNGDEVDHLDLESGEQVFARHYVDASGTSAILRRAMGVDVDYPTTLKNIAIYDYWQNADWAVEIGVGATRIQVLSLGYGWIWFIPLGPTRTSIGLVVPAQYFKDSGKRPEDLYAEAVRGQPMVASLLKNAVSEGKLHATKDWSCLAKRNVGKNWFLIGESAGFADPILSAGMSMAHLGGREVAYSILELDRGKEDPAWIKEQFGLRQSGRIRNHIRFADYWYSANAQFTELQEFCSELARDTGLDLSPEKAWAWIAQGGFIDEDLSIGSGGYSLSLIKRSGEFLHEIAADRPLDSNNVLQLALSDATWKDRARFFGGRVTRDGCYVRDGRVLPIRDMFEFVINLLQKETRWPMILEMVRIEVQKREADPIFMGMVLPRVPQAIEAMIYDGWIKASYDPALPLIPLDDPSKSLHWNEDRTAQH